MTEPDSDNPNSAFEAFSAETTVNSGGTPDSAKPSASLADLDGLLSEFEGATKAAEQPQAKPETKAQSTVEASDKISNDPVLSAIIKTQEAMSEEARKHLGKHGELVQRLWANELRKEAIADFNNVVTRVEKALAKEGIPVPEGRVNDWLTAQAVTNPLLREAFDNRYKSAQHRQAAERVVKRLTDAFIAQAREDHAYAEGLMVHADREAVAQHLRTASITKLPEPPPVRFGDITDAELSRQWEKLAKRA